MAIPLCATAQTRRRSRMTHQGRVVGLQLRSGGLWWGFPAFYVATV